MLSDEELDKRFDHHSPKDPSAMSEVRLTLKDTTRCILKMIPYNSRESSDFVTKMEEAMFWACAAIARNQ